MSKNKNILDEYLESSSRKMLDNAFYKIYTGNKPFFICINQILDVVYEAVNKNFLTIDTYLKIQDMLSYKLKSFKIISSSNELIQLIDSDNNTHIDSFLLKDFMIWLVSQFTSDSFFKCKNCNQTDYNSVSQKLLEMNEKKTLTSLCLDVLFSKIVSFSNAAILKDNFLFIDNELLLRIDNSDELSENPYSDIKKTSIAPVSSNDIFSSIEGDYFYINHKDGKGRKINLDMEEIEIIDGKILYMTQQEELLILEEDNIYIEQYYELGSKNEIVLDLLDSNEIRWIVTGKKNMSFYSFSNGTIKPSKYLESQIIWRFILSLAYEFYKNKDKNIEISYKLWINKICETPKPFTIENIKNSIQIIESKIINGYVKKSSRYIEIMYPILTSQYEHNKNIANELLNIYNINQNDIFQFTKKSSDGVLNITKINEFFDNIVIPQNVYL